MPRKLSAAHQQDVDRLKTTEHERQMLYWALSHLMDGDKPVAKVVVKESEVGGDQYCRYTYRAFPERPNGYTLVIQTFEITYPGRTQCPSHDVFWLEDQPALDGSMYKALINLACSRIRHQIYEQKQAALAASQEAA